MLLGWIRTAINQMWALVNSDSGGGFLAWIGENWKALTLILCGVGVVTDVVVYLVPLAAHAGMGQLLPPPARQGRGGG